MVEESFWWKFSCKILQILGIFWYRVFDCLIDRVLTCVFGHNTTILIMAIFVQVDCNEIEPALQHIRSYKTKKYIEIPLLI